MTVNEYTYVVVSCCAESAVPGRLYLGWFFLPYLTGAVSPP